MAGDRGKGAPCDLHRSSSPGLMLINKRFITEELRKFTRHFARDGNYGSGLRINIHFTDRQCFGEMDRSWRYFVIVLATFIGQFSVGTGKKERLSVLTP
jgi:hypothetical protein